VSLTAINAKKICLCLNSEVGDREVEMKNLMKLSGIAASVLASTAIAFADEKEDESYHADYIYGAPAEPSEAWMMSRGGRIYDNWYVTIGSDEPEETHSLWPANNTKHSGASTTRCKSCHGWDYRGAEGKYGSGSYQTGIKGVMGYSGSADELVALLRDAAHGYTEEMIPDEQAQYLSTFLAKGLVDMNAAIDFETGEAKGDAATGVAVFQTTCAACHGFDGRALNWGDKDDPAYIGTEANANPWEVLHKIRNGHPGVEMISLSAFPFQTAVDLLTYVRTLPEK
jgi:mono/diheme cytochrome c family protein